MASSAEIGEYSCSYHHSLERLSVSGMFVGILASPGEYQARMTHVDLRTFISMGLSYTLTILLHTVGML